MRRFKMYHLKESFDFEFFIEENFATGPWKQTVVQFYPISSLFKRGSFEGVE